MKFSCQSKRLPTDDKCFWTVNLKCMETIEQEARNQRTQHTAPELFLGSLTLGSSSKQPSWWPLPEPRVMDGEWGRHQHPCWQVFVPVCSSRSLQELCFKGKMWKILIQNVFYAFIHINVCKGSCWWVVHRRYRKFGITSIWNQIKSEHTEMPLVLEVPHFHLLFVLKFSTTPILLQSDVWR